MRAFSRLGVLLFSAMLLLLCTGCGRSDATPEVSGAPASPTQQTFFVPSELNPTVASEVVPGQVNVRETTGFSDEYNYWYVYGLVSNDSEQAVSGIEIEIKLLDANGNVLYTDTTNTANLTLDAGESSPFTFYTYESVSGVESVSAAVINSLPTSIGRAGLDFSGVQVWYDEAFNDVYVSGNVTNNNAEAVNIHGLAGTLRDANGALATANVAYPFLHHLEAGISAPFNIMFDAPYDQGAALTDYAFYLDAEFASATTYYNLVTSQEHYGYLDAYEDFHLVGILTNNSDAYLNVRLLAGIYDEAGNCIDASSLFLPMAVAPGESMPYDFDLWGALDSSREAYESATQFEIFIDWYSTYEAYLIPSVISTTDDNNTYDGYTATFTGNVLNNSGRDLDSATIIVSLYDRTTGELIATDYSHTTGPISNNSAVPYTANLYPQADFDPTNVEFTITTYGQ